MDVYVYKSSKKQGYYLYLKDKDNFDKIPDTLKNTLGTLELALEFDLHADRKLARADPATVLDNLHSQGFHLQIDNPLLVPENYKLR